MAEDIIKRRARKEERNGLEVGAEKGCMDPKGKERSFFQFPSFPATTWRQELSLGGRKGEGQMQVQWMWAGPRPQNPEKQLIRIRFLTDYKRIEKEGLQ